jgi:hypothetical protein
MRSQYELEMEEHDKHITWMTKNGGFAKDMTMRDHYAGLAMQGQLSMPELCVAISNGTTTVAALCGSCFEWADAMLKARDAK